MMVLTTKMPRVFQIGIFMEQVRLLMLLSKTDYDNSALNRKLKQPELAKIGM